MTTKAFMSKAFLCEASHCFDHAIAEGVLSDDEMAHNFAADFMYMGSNGTFDYFKHIDHRYSVTCQHGLSEKELATV